MVQDVKISNQNATIQARIDSPVNGVIPGWLVSIDNSFVPFMLVNGQSAKLQKWPIARVDVNEAIGLPGDFGFQFYFQDLKDGDVIELYIYDNNRLILLDQRVSADNSFSKTLYYQIQHAKLISKEPDSVAITCWDGGHNPIGRAFVLYQTISRKRPAVLLAYLFGEFSDKVWAPIANSNINSVLIPWENRYEYLDYMRLQNVTFNTIWMCKPRLPTFELSSNITNTETKLILDHDDNEEHFSRNTRVDRFYGRNSISVTRFLSSKILAHTAASKPLADRYSAQLVRHARNEQITRKNHLDPSSIIKIVFIGTVRSHKGLLEAAKAIKLSAWSTQLQLQFHVLGDVKPESLKNDLEKLGAKVGGTIELSNLYLKLQDFHILLTGFPTASDDDEQINMFQISSKIGDGLSVGRPVLVPYSQSTRDIESHDGVYLFSAESFSKVLLKIISDNSDIILPHEFTYDGAYESFRKAEKKAGKEPHAFSIIRSVSPMPTSVTNRQKLVLIWKQNDAGLYGRRVDQIARTLSEMLPEIDITVLELWHSSTLNAHQDQSFEFSSDSRLLTNQHRFKSQSNFEPKENLHYRIVSFDSTANLGSKFLQFINTNCISPRNAIFIIFPIVRFIENLLPIISNYSIIVDYVDNQFAWSSKKSQHELAQQYVELARYARHIIFNSEVNYNFFKESGILDRYELHNSCVIPNWYHLLDRKVKDENLKNWKNAEEHTHLLFSGNLNDRIDWELLIKVSRSRSDIILHIVGNGRRVQDDLNRLLDLPNIIYWGPLPEDKVWELSQMCSAGLVPHKLDKFSEFMNPMKVQMYAECGLPTITTELPGINLDEKILLCADHELFLTAVANIANARVSKKLASKKRRPSPRTDNASAQEYEKIVRFFFDELG